MALTSTTHSRKDPEIEKLIASATTLLKKSKDPIAMALELLKIHPDKLEALTEAHIDDLWKGLKLKLNPAILSQRQDLSRSFRNDLLRNLEPGVAQLKAAVQDPRHLEKLVAKYGSKPKPVEKPVEMPSLNEATLPARPQSTPSQTPKVSPSPTRSPGVFATVGKLAAFGSLAIFGGMKAYGPHRDEIRDATPQNMRGAYDLLETFFWGVYRAEVKAIEWGSRALNEKINGKGGS